MRLPLFVYTLCLDSMPFLACIYAELMRLTDRPWLWVCVEGVAAPVADTRWIAKQSPRLSQDGTTEFLDSISVHPRIRIIRQPEWPGKTAMCNAALSHFKERGVLLQCDSDEIHTADQMRRLVELFEDDPALMMVRFHCRFMLGVNIQTTDEGKAEEWLRAWRFTPGMRYDRHEPPTLEGNHGKSMSRKESAAMNLGFDHYAYALKKHVAQKERLYKRPGLLEGWQKLQANTEWPIKDAGDFAPTFRGTPCDRIF